MDIKLLVFIPFLLASSSEAQTLRSHISSWSSTSVTSAFYVKSAGTIHLTPKKHYRLAGPFLSMVETKKKNNPNLKLYPNPANNFLTVESDEKISLIRIMDLSGKILFSNKFSLTNFEIALFDLESGAYLIELNYLSDLYQPSTKKLIIQK